MCNNTTSDKIPITVIPRDERIANLCNIFHEEYGSQQEFVVKVPGRVNIIGEHIDYCGYPVLPLALEQDILVAGTVNTSRDLCIRNVCSKYEKYSVTLESFQNMKIEPDFNGKPYWYNYVLCGIKGALEFLNGKAIYGVELLIDGNIPPASGLSSSSALVSAACLSFIYAQNASLSKTEIASLCAKCERYIGTQGGGMDQAIAFLAEKNCAQYITFNPLKAQPVELPQNAVFVVAHSLAEANKAATNDFNRRVIECRLAAKVLASCEGHITDNKIVTLSEVQAILNKSLEEMIHLVGRLLTKNVYTKAEICIMLNVEEDALDNILLTQNTRHIKEFKLRQRALHVYKEAMRVETFRKVCEQASKVITGGLKGSNGSINISNGNGNTHLDNLSVLGKLMSESHESLKNLYECSHENLDRLVDISQEIDIPCRLTGAGWGGCVVALCPKESLESYIEKLVDDFYVQYCNIEKSKAYKYIFATKPSHGAIIYK